MAILNSFRKMYVMIKSTHQDMNQNKSFRNGDALSTITGAKY